jgi:hypothetical protein
MPVTAASSPTSTMRAILDESSIEQVCRASVSAIGFGNLWDKFSIAGDFPGSIIKPMAIVTVVGFWYLLLQCAIKLLQ